MHHRWGERAAFYAVYIREAHPADGWRMRSNDRVGITIAQPKTFDERKQVAARYCAASQMAIPLLVDGIDDNVGKAYSGFPDRLYVIDAEGRIAYKSGRGPFGYEPREMEQALVMLLLEDALKAAAQQGAESP